MPQTVEFRLQKADEYLQEAELLHREKIGNLPVLANLYHTMMNCLFAIFDISDIGNLTHADIIKRFKGEFTETGTFERKYSDAVDFAYNITHECNCDHMKAPMDKDIDGLFPVVREFVQVVTKYLIREHDESRCKRNIKIL